MSDQTTALLDQNCGNCRFFHTRDEDHSVCRRYPPFADPIGGSRSREISARPGGRLVRGMGVGLSDDGGGVI
jgi:hypothetical protein